MMSSLPITIIISTLFGFLAGIGVGGGSFLIMYLTLVLDLPYPQARIINLLFFIPAAIIASLFRWKQGKLDLKKIWPAIAAGCLAAAIFSQISSGADLHTLKKLFGILLVLTGLREILYKPKQKNKPEG